MAVLLEGINIPEGNPITVNIYRDGTWVNAYTAEDGNAIEVPELHGRLIDADAIPYKKIMYDDDDFYYGVTKPYIDRIPTVIPASEGG